MDQDSKFPLNESSAILADVERLMPEFAIVGLSLNELDKNKYDEITVTKYWITSGNFLCLDAFKVVDGFNEDLFIDYVDFDFGYRLQKAGKKQCYLNYYSLEHRIGNPIEFKLFGRRYYAMNHSPIRYYYRYRNSRYIFKCDPIFFFDKFIKELAVNIPKMLLFEPNKVEKLTMIMRGLKDGSIGKMGPFQRD